MRGQLSFNSMLILSKSWINNKPNVFIQVDIVFNIVLFFFYVAFAVIFIFDIALRLYLSGQITSAESISKSLQVEPVVLQKQGSIRRGRNNKDRKGSTDSHPGPIFLRNVVGGKRPYKMLVVAITVFVAISIIVILSVVYSNQ